MFKLFIVKLCRYCCSMVTPCAIFLTIIAAAILGIYFSGKYYFVEVDKYFQVVINSKDVLFETDKNYLSVALDTSFMRCIFHEFTERDWEKLEKLSLLLSPGYLRVGGNDADRTVFQLESEFTVESLNTTCEDFESDGEIIITGADWLKLNEFARKSNLSLIFDLNVLLRNESQWNETNAKALLTFSEAHSLPLHFQLGNEPDSFRHVFNISITGSELANDFYQLRKLLDSFDTYRLSKLIGPDITMPKNRSLNFLNEFLSSGSSVSAISWHQYYLNGHTAVLEDFINIDTFNLLSPQIMSVLNLVQNYSEDKPIWISETSSAHGGGAPGLSDRFVASFLWVDKLGLAARSNISVVIRQSLFKNHYALIGKQFSPNPDFWISVLFKHLVGSRVLDVNIKGEKDSHLLRFYGHCLAVNSPINGSVVIYGLNLSNETESFVPFGISIVYPVYSFIFKPKNDDLREEAVLNDHELHNITVISDMINMVEEVKYPLKIPSLSIGFWVLKEAKEKACRR